jgi:Cu-Zn family superoxide dismutase
MNRPVVRSPLMPAAANPKSAALSTLLYVGTLVGAASAATVLTGCGSLYSSSGPKAVAQLAPRAGSQVTGTVRFRQRGDSVIVHAEIAGLTPGQMHGFHVHDKGDCSAPDGMSTGGHFNPTNKPHGPQAADHHAGDMPALTADATGRAVADFQLTGVTLDDGPNSLVGRGLIVHKDPDDYKTQPTGNAGARWACAVITRG